MTDAGHNALRFLIRFMFFVFVIFLTAQVLAGAVSAQNASNSTTSSTVEGCQPVGDSPATVQVCDVRLEDGQVVFDLRSSSDVEVWFVLVDSSEEEGSAPSMSRSIPRGSSTVRLPSPSTRSVSWTVSYIRDGVAFGQVGHTVDLGPAPTWTEFLAGVTGAVLGVVINVVVAVFIVLRGRETFIRQLW